MCSKVDYYHLIVNNNMVWEKWFKENVSIKVKGSLLQALWLMWAVTLNALVYQLCTKLIVNINSIIFVSQMSEFKTVSHFVITQVGGMEFMIAPFVNHDLNCKPGWRNKFIQSKGWHSELLSLGRMSTPAARLVVCSLQVWLGIILHTNSKKGIPVAQEIIIWKEAPAPLKWQGMKVLFQVNGDLMTSATIKVKGKCVCVQKYDIWKVVFKKWEGGYEPSVTVCLFLQCQIFKMMTSKCRRRWSWRRMLNFLGHILTMHWLFPWHKKLPLASLRWNPSTVEFFLLWWWWWGLLGDVASWQVTLLILMGFVIYSGFDFRRVLVIW